MMKKYLAATIQEQIDRGMTLKKLISRPNPPELSALADRCKLKIDEIIEQLRYILSVLESRAEDDIRDISRSFRRLIWDLELVEYFGISALYFQTPEIEYLNKLIYKIHREINLPLTPPAVSCISTNYYYYHPFTNVIFVPLGESEFLLHLADVFHEIGHEVSFKKVNEPILKEIREKYRAAIIKITEYYNQLIIQKSRETGPEEIPMHIAHIHSQWKEHWIEEFFSDLFALYTLGPAYAWAHLHLTMKKSKDVYELSLILPQKHPSDDARMTMLLLGLKLLGFEEESDQIKQAWKKLPIVDISAPTQEYQYAFPESLMKDVQVLILEGLKTCKFTITDKDRLQKLEDTSIIKSLNDGWNKFWNDPSDYREWEEKKVSDLKKNI